MSLGRSRGADAVCFCSGLLIRRNDLENTNLHFDRKNATRNDDFDFSVSKKRRPTLILIKNLPISTEQVLGLTT